MRSSLAVLATASLLPSSALALPQSRQNTFSWQDTKYLIAFGDSYTYVQGTHGLQNYSFIGDFLDFSYTPEQLLTDRIVQNQTATAEGGPNWIEYLTNCGVHEGLTDPKTCNRQLWDFAFAGADISEEYTALHHPYTVPLVNQTQQFLTYGLPVLSPLLHLPQSPSQTLTVFWIGINDIDDTSEWTNITSFPTFYQTLIDTQFSAVESIYQTAGLRNFLFMNLPPLDKTPGNVARAAGPRPNVTMVDQWDRILLDRARKFEEEHRDARAMVFDVNSYLNEVIDDAGAYGIRNTTGYCASYDQPFINTDPEMYGCLPLSEYFWFNDGHLTSHVHEILAGEVGRFLVTQSR